MGYVTVEVDIEKGRIVPRGSVDLPEKGTGLLTILVAEASVAEKNRPIGLAKGDFVVPSDFNDPLPEEILRGFEGA